MANPKCKYCGEEVLDKSLATKKGNRYYHNDCLVQYEEEKRVRNLPLDSCKDQVRLYLEYSGIEESDSIWSTVMNQINLLQKRDNKYTYNAIAYTLWYCRYILEIQMTDTLIIGLVEWNFDKAKEYHYEFSKISQQVQEFEFKDEVVVIKKKNVGTIRKEITFD